MSGRNGVRCPVCGGAHHDLLPDGRRWLTVREAALHLDVSEDTVRGLIEGGKLGWKRPSDRTTRVLEADVVALNQEQRLDEKK